MNGIILAAVCLAASGLSAEQQAAQPLLLSLGDGTVVLPDDCAGKRADAPSGDVARIDCADGQNRIAHASGIEHVTYEPPMAASRPGIEGSLRCGLEIYWGASGRTADEFCAVVRYKSEAPGQYLGHSFCTRSGGKAPRDRVRVIALSFRRTDSAESTPCGQAAKE
jgi:hypothetical protein